MTVQDDLANDPGELSLQYSGAYGRSREAGAREVLEQGLTLKLGVIENVQLSVNPNYVTGRAEGHDSGGFQADVLVHLRDQTRLLPAVGFDLFYTTPFGSGRKAAEYVFRAIASHSLGDGDAAPRLHLNVTDFHLTQLEGDDRKDRLQLAFGASFLPSEAGAIVGDVVYGAADFGRGTQTFLEVGYTRVLPHAWTCELGIGQQVAGAGGAVHVFFSVEKEVHVF